MKVFLVVVVFMFASMANAQTAKSVDELSFAAKTFKTPGGCQAPSPFQLQCADYSMVWIYMNTEMLKTMPEQAIDQLSTQLKDFKKKEIAVFLMGEKVKGYKITFKNQTDGKNGYQIVAYGVVNQQPLLFQLSLEKDPTKNAELPEFTRQIVGLEKP